MTDSTDVNLSTVAAYLGPDAVSEWDDATLTSALAAEQSAQARVVRVPSDAVETGAYPTDLAEALFRRVAHNLALRRLPLSVQANVSEFGASTTRVGGEDAEVRRLERPWRRLPIA